MTAHCTANAPESVCYGRARIASPFVPSDLIESLLGRGPCAAAAVSWGGAVTDPRENATYRCFGSRLIRSQAPGFLNASTPPEAQSKKVRAMPDTRPEMGHPEILEIVGKGGMATVYRGRRRETGQVVAIKVMEPRFASNPILVKRFEQEYAAAARLHHPNIIQVWDFGQENGRPYLVMELIDGEKTWATRSKRRGTA